MPKCRSRLLIKLRYIRDCIVNPRSFSVAGYPPVMPNYSGQMSEGDLLKVVAYIKSLGTQEATDP